METTIEDDISVINQNVTILNNISENRDLRSSYHEIMGDVDITRWITQSVQQHFTETRTYVYLDHEDDGTLVVRLNSSTVQKQMDIDFRPWNRSEPKYSDDAPMQQTPEAKANPIQQRQTPEPRYRPIQQRQTPEPRYRSIQQGQTPEPKYRPIQQR